MIIKKIGCWNCIPQPIETPILLIIIKIIESKTKEVIIPSAVIKKLLLIELYDLVSLFFKTDMNFSDITGKTQGMTFKINPPSIAIKIIVKKKLLNWLIFL